MRAVTAVVDVAEEALASDGAGVRKPALREALELLPGGGGEDLVDEAKVARGSARRGGGWSRQPWGAGC
ncbi:MAG: hypothetical protein R3F14_17680 [Polyangiaceae bacterium]